MPKLDVPSHKLKKIYRKPELKALDPQAAIEKLRPLALAGDKSAQQLIQSISEKNGIGR